MNENVEICHLERYAKLILDDGRAADIPARAVVCLIEDVTGDVVHIHLIGGGSLKVKATINDFDGFLSDPTLNEISDTLRTIPSNI